MEYVKGYDIENLFLEGSWRLLLGAKVVECRGGYGRYTRAEAETLTEEINSSWAVRVTRAYKARREPKRVPAGWRRLREVEWTCLVLSLSLFVEEEDWTGRLRLWFATDEERRKGLGDQWFPETVKRRRPLAEEDLAAAMWRQYPHTYKWVWDFEGGIVREVP